uniref:Uncharacterized protein n=1 Tax=Leersia perrieri TaxID=77586 RepID=A0A0D9X418_9ORYZ
MELYETASSVASGRQIKLFPEMIQLKKKIMRCWGPDSMAIEDMGVNLSTSRNKERSEEQDMNVF